MAKRTADNFGEVNLRLEKRVPIQAFCLLWLVLTAVIGALAFCVAHGSRAEQWLVGIGTGILVLNVGLLALTAYCSWHQTVLSRDSLAVQRKADALALLARWDDPVMDDARLTYRTCQEMRQLPGNMSDPDFVNFMLQPDSARHRFAVMDLGNLLEDVEQAIRSGLADADMLAAGYVPLVRNACVIFAPWFDYLKDNQPHIWGAYVPFRGLQDRWREMPPEPLADPPR